MQEICACSWSDDLADFVEIMDRDVSCKSFRKERLEEHITEMKKPFALVQVIPATFRSDYVPMYDMYREGKLDFDNLFNGMIRDRAVPNVDGVYFPDYSKLRDFEKLQIFNNGTVELKIDFEIREQNSKSQQLKTERYLIIFDFVEELKNLIYGTSTMYRKLGRSTAMYVCVTIVGCKDLWNYTANAYGANTPGIWMYMVSSIRLNLFRQPVIRLILLRCKRRVCLPVELFRKRDISLKIY